MWKASAFSISKKKMLSATPLWAALFKPMTTTRHIPDKARSSLSIFLERLDKKLPPKAFFLLVFVILILAALASMDFSGRRHLFTEGEIATDDVIADRTFLFRDKQATMARQELLRTMQPLVLDLDITPADILHDRLQRLLLTVAEAHGQEREPNAERMLHEEFGEDLPPHFLTALAAPPVQSALLTSLLPYAEQRLRGGVLQETSVTRAYPGGAIIRNPTTGEEVLHQEAYSLPDLTTLKLQLAQRVTQYNLSPWETQALDFLLQRLIRPTLTPNYELTKSRADAAADSVDPILYRVLRGEMIIQQGDRITREQQVKMQLLVESKQEIFDLKKFLGIFLCAMLMVSGTMFSPSGRAGSSMTNKDFLFLSLLLAFFSLLAKGLSAHGAQIASVTIQFLPESLAFAVPVAGAAALSGQIFSARRYLVTGLLLAFFCTLMMKGSLGLFLFYFLSAMWSTWLTNRSASRRDVVWSLLPLAAGLFAMWAGATLMQGGAHNRYFSEMIAVIAGAALSMFLTFSLTPVVEMAFGYTTRFRLMELLNLEQPLLRDLMLNAPGTYHHSLIVSNMCEAGAKALGAHSLLCKVAALYHDIGKTLKAGYFIENQPPDDNPHTKLLPSMSALILISHVKQGVVLANRHRLGQEVTDIIRQHHGTSIIQYFYHKALSQTDAPPPNSEDFRYPGPRPRSREAALVMLADIVEASSRSLTDPTPTRLRQHTDSIMKNIYAAGQLDESELTFKNLDTLAESFQQVLRGLYHHRVRYPGGQNDKEKADKPGMGKTACRLLPDRSKDPARQTEPPSVTQ
jgi:putative nucleotidyltransferase with HDIG domain